MRRRRDVTYYLDLIESIDRVRNWILARALVALRYGTSERAPKRELKTLTRQLPEFVWAPEARSRLAMEGIELEPIRPVGLEILVDRVTKVRPSDRLTATALLAEQLEVDLQRLLEWTSQKAAPTGDLAEQLRPRLRRMVRTQIWGT